MKTTRFFVTVALFALLAVLLGNPTSPAGQPVTLSSLNLGLIPGKDAQRWTLPKADRAATGRPLSVKNKKYDHGIGTRAGSSYFILAGGAQRFSAAAAVDDATGFGELGFRKVQFLVLGDGKVLFDSGAMIGNQPPKKVDVDVRGVKLMELRVVDLASGQPPAYVDWLDAVLDVEGEAPRATANAEPAEILTPKPGPGPRINGARVFGVRPGSPFLFTIAATGERPMTFAAEGLPEGLTLDEKSGVISGTIASREAKTYRVAFTAKNSVGQAQRALDIVVGPQICLTPPLGWNSWNCYAATVDQEKVLATAKAMVAKGLKDHGWTYVNIDDTWQGKRGGPFNAIQGNEKFPDMKGLCDQVHALGLKVGIYSTPWTTSYAKYIGGSSDDVSGEWTHTKNSFGKYPFAANDARQWAAWGMDYLKYDWRPLDIPHVKEMADALRASGRDIVYSLSNTAVYEQAAQYARLANCWRTTGDIRDVWDHGDRLGQGFAQGIADIEGWDPHWQPFAGPGHYNDPDMLVVGKVGWGALRPSNLTPNELYTHVSLWCLWSAPLLIGAPVDQLDDFTVGLLTNDEVLEVSQDPLCRQAQRVAKYGAILVYAKPMHDGSLAVGLFNFGFERQDATLYWSDLGIAGPHNVRDLWRQRDLGVKAEQYQASIPRHGVLLLRLTAASR